MENNYTASQQNTAAASHAKVISIASGKAGVGKTNLCTNLALSLSALGKKVCVLDANQSSSGVNQLLGISPEFSLDHLLDGDKELKEIIIDGPRGLKIIAGASKISSFSHYSASQKETLLSTLDLLQDQFDYLLIDTAAGLQEATLNFIQATQYSLLVITPDPTSLTDAFSVLKNLKRAGFDKMPYVVVNIAQDEANSLSVFERFESTISKYIDIKIEYLGFVQVDETVISSASVNCPAVLLKPDCIASQCYKELAKKTVDSLPIGETVMFSKFWQQQGSHKFQANDEKTAEPLLKVAEINTMTSIPPSTLTELDKPTAPNNKTDTSHTLEPQMNLSNDHSIELPYNKKTLRDFYSYLDSQDYPKNLLKDINRTIDVMYHQKHGNSIEDFETTLARLFVASNHQDEDYLHLNKRLQEYYQREFNKPLINIHQLFIDSVSSSSFSKNDFNAAITELLAHYQEKFSETFKTVADTELEAAKTVIADQKIEISALQAELTEAKKSCAGKATLLNKFQQLAGEINFN